ncbi:hypothetical protein CY34DRAFT_695279 [Suillus luteus UH-Slu-Lm8-n1]|uniref:Uncharacterized protein n=1 Tax=Suillus luteus UH-Slu-Lm8-n1 TaxID=930992 RepID=A0A0D0AP77_9AGAM|nr:hypothetical protein CY34DRAFT_695279 [Suillus luteus UH-Slu-Lm8-n1]
MRHGNFIRLVHLVPGFRLSIITKTRFVLVGGTSWISGGLHTVLFIPYLAGVQFRLPRTFVQSPFVVAVKFNSIGWICLSYLGTPGCRTIMFVYQSV